MAKNQQTVIGTLNEIAQAIVERFGGPPIPIEAKTVIGALEEIAQRIRDIPPKEDEGT